MDDKAEKNKGAKDKRKVTIEIHKSEDFRQIYAIGALGGHSPYDFRISFYNDSPQRFGPQNNTHVMKRQIETELILSPLAALELSRWLNQHLQEYEKKFGPITRPRTKAPDPKSTDNSSNIQGYT
ncbi:conserved hypothetical protein [Methanosalsum zhilinae DSM 4017]|uniref:DUF3467 domain-containing protein n=1 Tax=Methanosalsum zhilinae (strain DSM 4017 / NBRC 107636 / OCM 62 / WeN5) TaxID=679901 RepID=F7XKQ2_METZD|nr:DUF3467 domain-containing protein [Methanosalsum zhilinae]AEH60664.1 conserved hypothetical protein [Methanosalsum zhilinae DSM 4017]